MSKILNIRIPDPKVWSDFKALILDENDSDYAVTGRMVQQALETLMAIKGWKNYDKKIILPNSPSLINTIDTHTHKSYNKRKMLLLYAFEKTFLFDNYIPIKEIESFIRRELKVKDKRTINDWVKFLRDEGLIYKHPRDKKWENKLPADTPIDDWLKEKNNIIEMGV